MSDDTSVSVVSRSLPAWVRPVNLRADRQQLGHGIDDDDLGAELRYGAVHRHQVRLESEARGTVGMKLQ
jgi:hypothetical protein